ncbi:hypothetical protein TrRE_jg5319 [Triparma retinervis]|uniref:Uncharacterized protein n=1 Tax=Triparma retinervis TaxID=2557542 RepID=A0A9W7A917_9STRA|nr:hypothetical protein TrRE_jg5319 [Triparma retinervis]
MYVTGTEIWNSWSNMAFIIVGIAGIVERSWRWQRETEIGTGKGRESEKVFHELLTSPTPAFLLCDLLIITVGVGSYLFHSTRLYVWQLSDELPMSLLLAGYSWVQREIYLRDKDGEGWDERKRRRFLSTLLSYLYALLLICSWYGYLVLQNHSLFVSFFSVQIGFTIGAYVLGGKFQGTSAGWHHEIASMACMIAGKALWELERDLYKEGRCPVDWGNVEYYLHAWWHVFSAAGHYYCCVILSVRGLQFYNGV